jgi:SAM-dependent methyltransferase
MDDLRDYNVYSTLLDVTLEQKISVVLPWITGKVHNVVDFGCGTGALVAELARRFPNIQFIGVENNPVMFHIASHFTLPNLTFAPEMTEMIEMTEEKNDLIICSSVLHEVYSYNNDDLYAVEKVLRSMKRILSPDGKILIRDFVSPSDGSRKVLLHHASNDQVQGHSFHDFSRECKRTTKCSIVDGETWETTMKDAYEFIYRKDFHDNWLCELEEKYGFWTNREACEIMASLDLSIVHFETYHNEWIVKNRLENKISLFSVENLEQLAYPKYQMVLCCCSTKVE